MKKTALALFIISALLTGKSVAANSLQQAPNAKEEVVVINSDDQQKEPYMVRKFPANTISNVHVNTSGGSIQVNGGAASDAVVEMYVTPNNNAKWSKEKIDKVLLDNYVIEIKSENGQLIASAKRIEGIKWSSDNGLSIAFKISVKKETNTNAKTSGGSIKLSNLAGTQEFSTSGGSLRADNLSGKINGRTSGGSIQVSNSKDVIDLSTSGGSIKAENCTGQLSLKTSGGSMTLSKLSGTVSARTSGGSIRMKDLDGTIDAKTSGGSVSANDIKGTLLTGTSGGSMTLAGISGNLEATTSAGNMTVSMKSVNEYVRLRNSGNVSLTLPAGKGYNLKIKASKVETVNELTNFKGRFETGIIDGAVNGGGAEISISSSQRAKIAFE